MWEVWSTPPIKGDFLLISLDIDTKKRSNNGYEKIDKKIFTLPKLN